MIALRRFSAQKKNRARTLRVLVAAAMGAMSMPAWAMDYHWAVSAGTWNNGPNWSPSGEPGINDFAYLDYNSNATIHVIDNVPTVEWMTIGNGDTLNLEHNGFDDGFASTSQTCQIGIVDAHGSAGTINVLPRPHGPIFTGEGHLSVGEFFDVGFSGTVNQSGGTVSVGANLAIVGGQYNLSGGTCSVTTQVVLSNPGTFTMSGGELDAGGTTVSSPSFYFHGGTLNAGDLLINNHGQMHLGAGGGKVLHATSINIGTINGGGFDGGIDLADNALIDDQPSSLGQILNLIRNGTYDGLTDTSTGIISSTAIINGPSAHPTTLGYAVASDLGLSTFMGQSVTPESTLVRYTYVGDANLDGVVNALDFNALAANYGTGGKNWWQGDFTGDGIVNSQDFDALAANFGEVLPSGAALPMSAVVPEPVMGLSLFAMGACWLNRQRRRGR